MGIPRYRRLRVLSCRRLLRVSHCGSDRCRHGTSSAGHPYRTTREAFLEAIHSFPRRFRTVLLHGVTSGDRRLLHQLYYGNKKPHIFRTWCEVSSRSSRLLRGWSIQWFIPDEVHKAEICLSGIHHLCPDIQCSVHYAATEHGLSNANVDVILRVSVFPNDRRAGYPWARKTYKERSWLDRGWCFGWSVSNPSHINYR
jgi:hypothetical protein